MKVDFGYFTNLQYKVKSLTAKVKAFESGEAYITLRQTFEKLLRAKDREIRELKEALAKAHSQADTVRNHWFEVIDDMEKESKKELAKKVREIKTVKEQLFQALRQRDEEKEKRLQKTRELYEALTELEEEREKNRKLTAQVNKDFENSSIPSSMKIGRKKIHNSRKQTNRKPGGQPGHPGHGRKRLHPTQSHEIPAPEKYASSPDFRPTGKTIRKEKIILHVDLEVIEYTTPEYRNVKTGQRVHADFPEGFVDEVNYDGSVKAFAYLLGNECNVSHDKIREFLSELTNGELQISKGMINRLIKEFSRKTEPEQKEIYVGLMSHPVMNTDFTNANVNGKSAQVLICASPFDGSVLLLAREHKGHAGIAGSPVADYQGILVHDHDVTFYNYGLGHQECMQHNIRYLKGSIENEPDLEWNSRMLELIREMLHYRNGLGDGEKLDVARVEELEKKYDEILEKALNEYQDDPPSKYYMEGYNLYRRLEEYKESELLFLKNELVPSNNSLSERIARVYKRKQKQAIVLRSLESFCHLCNGLSVIYSQRQKNINLYEFVSEIFRRKYPPKTTEAGTLE